MDFEPDRFAVNRYSKYDHSQLITRKHQTSHSSSHQLIVFDILRSRTKIRGNPFNISCLEKEAEFSIAIKNSVKSRPITLCAADILSTVEAGA